LEGRAAAWKFLGNVDQFVTRGSEHVLHCSAVETVCGRTSHGWSPFA
jgi:hypothetical protein